MHALYTSSSPRAKASTLSPLSSSAWLSSTHAAEAEQIAHAGVTW